MEDVNLLLSFMETEVLKGKKNRLSGGVSVNPETMLNLLGRVREAVNTMNGESLIEESRDRARVIIEDAEKERAKILNRDTMLATAKAMAKKVEEDAEAYRANLIEETNKYVLSLLVSAMNNVAGLQKTLENAINEFKKQ